MDGTYLPGALVQILQGPTEFQANVATLSGAPGWETLTQRIDRTLSQVDGVYTFIDLPAGTYQLNFSLPQAGRRYGSLQVNNVSVATARDPAGRAQVSSADAALTPTQITGKVTRQDNNQPVTGARVSLQGDPAFVLTDAAGQYLISGIEAVKPTVAVTAANFKPFSQGVSLTPGALLNLNVSLTPA